MEYANFDSEKAVWQRVARREQTAYDAIAAMEAAVCAQCRELSRRGYRRRAVTQLYHQARARQRTLASMARRAGLPGHEAPRPSAPASVGTLLELLGRLAWAYDPADPVYGPLFSQLRAECAGGQRMLLEGGRH